jgi:hypothetical protein
MKVKIIIQRSSNQESQTKAVMEPELMHSAACPPQPLISFADHLGKLGRSALKKQQAPEVMPQKTDEPAAAHRGLLSRVISWLNGNLKTTKQLRVLETVTLGDKRLIAVVQADGRRFLVGGGPSGISLLTQLDHTKNPLDQFGSSAGLTELAG